jgi:hypothetical protein
MVKNNGIWKVGELSYRVIKLLGLSLQEGSPIYIGKENIRHIKKSHLRDFQKYGKDINKIISFPNYISRNPKKNSIEYIKVYIGKENIRHIKKSHLRDFQKYGKDINKIISFPNYISRNPKKNSIEYIKVYEDKKDYVLVAVRPSSSGILYIRILFIMSYEKIAKYWIKKVFKMF